MAQPTFPFLGPFPPSPNVSTGTSFEDGLRIGRIPADQNGNSVGPGMVPIGGTSAGAALSPQFLRWGQGLPMSPIVSYNICPFNAWTDYSTPPQPADICTFAPGTASGAYGTLTPSGTSPNLDSTWAIPTTNLPNFFTQAGYGINPAQPSVALRFDWPRAIGIQVTGADLATSDTQINVWGYDFWGNPMSAIYGNISGGVVNNGLIQAQNVGSPDLSSFYEYCPFNGTTLTNVPGASQNFTNKAFYIVTAVQYQSTSGVAVTAGATINVVTTRTMGLPYYFGEQGSMLLGAFWKGFTQLSGQSQAAYSPGALLGLAGLPFAANYPGTDLTTGNYQAQLTTGLPIQAGPYGLDVRGTYSASTQARGSDVPAAGNRLLLAWLNAEIDPILYQYREAYLPQSSADVQDPPTGQIVDEPSLVQWMGAPQYVGPV